MKIALIDGSNLFRVKSRNRATTINGDPCGGVVGMAHAILRFRQQGYVVICALEGKNSTSWRKSIIKSYKAKRGKHRTIKGTPSSEEDNLRWQWNALIVLLELINVPLVFSSGKEGDDMIAFMVHKMNQRDEVEHVKIVSNDGDFHSLLTREGKVHLTSSLSTQELTTYESFVEEHGHSPELTIWYKCTVGDPSDGIKGIPGIGAINGKRLLRAMHEAHEREPVEDVEDFIGWVESVSAEKLIKTRRKILDNEILIRPLFKVLSLSYPLVARRMQACYDFQGQALHLADATQWFREYKIRLKPPVFSSASLAAACAAEIRDLFGAMGIEEL